MPSNTIAGFGRDFASGKNTERINELCKHKPTALEYRIIAYTEV